MSDSPYRPEPTTKEEDALLARLTAEGQRRLHQAAEDEVRAKGDAERQAEADRERYIRMQLGAYYSRKTSSAVCFMLIALGAIVCVIAMVSGRVGMAASGFLLVVASGLALMFVRPAASRKGLAAEEAWLRALPFQVDGYFEGLGAEPRCSAWLELGVEWTPGRAPSVDTLYGVFGNWDAGVHIELGTDAVVTVTGSTFVCGTDMNGNPTATRSYVCPNRRLVERTHQVIEGALLPLHQSYPISRVRLTVLGS